MLFFLGGGGAFLKDSIDFNIICHIYFLIIVHVSNLCCGGGGSTMHTLTIVFSNSFSWQYIKENLIPDSVLNVRISIVILPLYFSINYMVNLFI